MDLIAIGDSKTAFPMGAPRDWKGKLIDYLAGDGINAAFVGVLAQAGWTTADVRGQIDAFVSQWPKPPSSAAAVSSVLYTLSTNDTATNEAQWEADTGYIWDAVHAAYPNALLLYSNIPLQGAPGNEATFKTWFANVASTRPWAIPAVDETAILVQGTDTIAICPCPPAYNSHENEAGAFLVASSWRDYIEANR